MFNETNPPTELSVEMILSLTVWPPFAYRDSLPFANEPVCSLQQRLW